MTDYRLKQNRGDYFTRLYALNLEHRIMPGLVYLYMPELVARFGWSEDQRLWFAFLNGLTQNPITSLVMMGVLPECPEPGDPQSRLSNFEYWFNESWARLQFDVDRQKNKRLTVAAIRGYARMVKEHGGQAQVWTGTYPELWARARQVPSFGRLSAFSFLEYVRIMGFGADCDDLMFGDLEGSRSHRNGMLMLMGRDDLVMDRRAGNGVRGYRDLADLAEQMEAVADSWLKGFRDVHPDLPHASRFTLESNLCTFKNHFFGRRYPGVYADMAWERILWAEEHGWKGHPAVFRDIRKDCLPGWLRLEDTPDRLDIRQRAFVFPQTGWPYRGDWFLPTEENVL